MAMYVIDSEGFMLMEDKTYIIKELAYMRADGCDMRHQMLEPPFHQSMLKPSDVAQCNWVTSNIHGIRWNEGSTAYSALPEILALLKQAKTLAFSKGIEKVRVLKQFGLQAVNLEAINCPQIRDQKYAACRICTKHKSQTTKHCALEKTIAYAQWMRDNTEITNRFSSHSSSIHGSSSDEFWWN